MHAYFYINKTLLPRLLIWRDSSLMDWMGHIFEKSFVDTDIRYLVLAVRFRKRSCHSSSPADSRHSNKKALMRCLWRSALPGIAPSVIANQRPEYKLTGTMEVNSPAGRERAISGHRWFNLSPAVAWRQKWFDDLNSKFKRRPLPLISEWQMVNTLHE